MTKLNRWNLYRGGPSGPLQTAGALLISDGALYITCHMDMDRRHAIDVWDVHSCRFQRQLFCPSGRPGSQLAAAGGAVRVESILYVAFNSGDIGESVTGTLKAFLA